MLDQIDTPHLLAIEIAEALGGWSGGRAFDPTVGRGALLRAVRLVHGGQIDVAGADIDRARIAELALREPDWILGYGDSLRVRSRASNRAWAAARASCEAVLFNPPFSFRGGAGVSVSLQGEDAIVSPALAFVLAAAELRPTRGMVGVLPAGAIHNLRDSVAWDYLHRSFEIDIVRTLPRGAFPGVAASSLLVSMTNRGSASVALDRAANEILVRGVPQSYDRCVCVEVFRGRAQIWDSERWGGREAILHTTDLVGPEWATRGSLEGADPGPLVIVPRVGKPDPAKVVVLTGAANLSDCLMALRPRDPAWVPTLAEKVVEEFSALEQEYLGTGAPHVTLGRLKSFISRLGFAAVDRGQAGHCSCGSRVVAAA